MVVIQFDKALSSETLSNSDPKTVVDWLRQGPIGASGMNLGYYATEMTWDVTDESRPQLVVRTKHSEDVPLISGAYVTFIDGAIKDIKGNVIKKTGH